MSIFKSNKAKMFEPGDKVVLLGSTDHERNILTYNDPVSFVTDMIHSKGGGFSGFEDCTNHEFMERIANLMEETNLNIPHHSEEAFIQALIRYGVCLPAVLN